MPPKRENRRKKDKPLFSAAMAYCVFPQSVMFNIVTRLPVKSIHRYKAVCKPWCKLFSTPKFMKTHHAQLSKTPENQSVIIYHFGEEPGHIMSLYKVEPEPNGELPINLDHPYPKHFYLMDFVGCVNGLLCLAAPLAAGALGQLIQLWNPALNLSRTLPIPDQLKTKEQSLVSIGFGYDDTSDDFKVVRIVHVADRNMNRGKKTIVGVDVYSGNSDSWRIIDVGFQFSVAESKNQAIVNGNPYWVAKLEEYAVLVMFDVRKMKFKFVVPLTDLSLGEHVDVPFVDWKGAIAALISKKNEERVLSLDVWVLDDVEKVWIKNRSFGPIELKVDRFMQCLQNGEIIGVCNDGKLFVLDAAAAAADDDEENGGGGSVKKEIVIHGVDKRKFQIYGYTPSLAYVKGMEKVKTMPWEEDRASRFEYGIRHTLDFLKLSGFWKGPIPE